jgi:hypothetical protein
MADRKQINFRADDELEEAIEEIRRLTSPIPSVSNAIRQAVLNERDRLRRKSDGKAARK